MSELKPCPFPHCGNHSLHVTSNGESNFFVECRHCGASGPVHFTENDAIGGWNLRDDTATAELRRELEEVKASRDALKREVEGLRGLSEKLLSRLEPHADEDCQCEACGLQAAINQREK